MSSKIILKLNISKFRIFQILKFLKIFIPSLTPLQKEDGPDLGTENFAPFTGHCSPVPYFLNFQKSIHKRWRLLLHTKVASGSTDGRKANPASCQFRLSVF